MRKSTLKAISFRIPNLLNEKMINYCLNHDLSQSTFIRSAIEEKLLRNSIEENIIIRANTIEVEHMLQDYLVLIENNFQRIRDDLQSILK
ncbi:MAG: hypothetical protein ACW967_05725 [Candidatus Hodarchaeales archaeon]